MFGWLRRKIGNWATDSQREDLERFVVSLRGQDPEELGTVVLMATVVRLNLGPKTLPITALEGLATGTDQEVMAPLMLNRLIRELQQQGSLPQAAGAMVWLHSVRAINAPELRLLGRQMWGELVRGFAFVNEARIGLMVLTGKPVDSAYAEAARYIPSPLKPRS